MGVSGIVLSLALPLVCGMTHRKSSLDIFVVSLLGPIVATVVVETLGSLFPGLVIGDDRD